MNVKKIIAREGLVIIGMVSTGITIGFLSSAIIENITSRIEKLSTPYNITSEYSYEKKSGVADIEGRKDLNEYSKDELKTMIKVCKLREVEHMISSDVAPSGLLLIVFGYPLYLLIRFIIWAVKTLKEK